MGIYQKIIILGCFLLLSLVTVEAQVNALQPTACRFRLPGRVRIDCYTLRVPENRQNPESRNIQLALAILRHPDGMPEPDPIVFLQGGPGGASLDTLFATYQGRFEPLFATNRDIILLDQRGVGRSNPILDCPAYELNRLRTLDYDIDGLVVSTNDIINLLNDSLVFCGNTLGEQYDLSGFNSIESAADLDALREAFGYDQLNLWGISYGTRLALTAIRDYPDSFRRVVLDAVYPLEVNLFTELPINFDRALHVLFEACTNDTSCAETFPDLERVLFQTVNDLNRRPIRIDALDMSESRTYDNVVFNGNLLMDMLFQLMYSTDVLPNLPQLIYMASERDMSTWRVIAGWYIGQRDAVSLGMYYAVQCQEEIAFTADNAINDAWANFPNFEFYSLGIRDVTTLRDICTAFNAGTAPLTENEAVTSDLPVLIFSGEYDPITPPAWATQTHTNFPNSLYFNLPASGHGVSGDVGCAQTITIAYFSVDDIATIDTSCIDEIELIFSGTQVGDFVPPDDARSGSQVVRMP